MNIEKGEEVMKKAYESVSRKELELLGRLYRISEAETSLEEKLRQIALDVAEVFACPYDRGNRSSCRVLFNGASYGEEMDQGYLQAGAPIFTGEDESGVVEFFCTADCPECPEIADLIRSSGIIDMVAEHIGLLTLKEQQKQEIEKARRLREHILRASAEGFWLIDNSGCFTDVNDTYLEMSGYSREEFLALSISDIDADEDDPAVGKRMAHLLEKGKSTFRVRHRRKDGTLFHVEISASVMASREDPAEYTIVCFCRDVTEKERDKRRIEGLLQEKEILLKEIHHRVKNDLSFIHSILRLQESMQEEAGTGSGTEQGSSPLTDAQNRIALVMQVYEELYQGSSVTEVESEQLLSRISTRLGNGNYGASPAFIIKSSPFTIPARMGIAVGTLLNEMVINSLKYGIPRKDASPSIHIELTREEKQLKLLVRDNGPGFPKEVLSGEKHGFGLTVIDALARQYGGTMELANRPGAEICVIITMVSS